MELTSTYSTADSLQNEQPFEPAQGIVLRISQAAKAMVHHFFRPVKPAKSAITTCLEHAVTHAAAEMLILAQHLYYAKITRTSTGRR